MNSRTEAAVHDLRSGCDVCQQLAPSALRATVRQTSDDLLQQLEETRGTADTERLRLTSFALHRALVRGTRHYRAMLDDGHDPAAVARPRSHSFD